MTYRVLSTSSLGYQLQNSEDGSLSIHKSRGRMTFRDQKITVGDYVELDEDGYIVTILPRKNSLSRPRLSNCDTVYVIVSAKEPDFSSYLLDKFLTNVASFSLNAGIIVSKADLLKKKEISLLRMRLAYYQKIGYSVYLVDSHKKDKYDFPLLENDIRNQSCAFVGQTGVGKSSLLNTLYPDFRRKVDAMYVSSGRGRHTTKEVILLPFGSGYLFDTPGFSALDLIDVKTIELAHLFPGYDHYSQDCYFKDCRHLNSSKGCAVLKAIQEDALSEDSYQNYCKIFDEVRINDQWKKKI